MIRFRRNVSAIRLAAASSALAIVFSACMQMSPEEVAKVETSSQPGFVKPDELGPVPEYAFRHGSPAPLAKSAAAAAWVGLIPKDPSLPCTDMSLLRQDNEDEGNANRVVFNGKTFTEYNAEIGGIGSFRKKLSTPTDKPKYESKTEYRVCHEFATSLPIMKYDYAVLASENSCPTNGILFMRHFDDEDNNNANYYDDLLLPSFAINSYSRLYYCFVPGNSQSPDEFPRMTFLATGNKLEDNYMIFAENHSYPTSGYIVTDDEDDKNNNSFTNFGASEEMFTRFRKIIRGVNGGGVNGSGRNTEVYFAATGTPPKVVTSNN